jgi:hypothetical protein
MPVNNQTLNKNLYDALRALGHDPISLNSKGDPTNDVEEADVFRFSVKSDGEKVNGWATIGGPELILYTDDKFNKMDGFDKFTEYMKTWSQRKLLGFNITNKDHLRYDMQKRTNMKNKERLGEGYYPINKKSSFNDSVPQVKILIQHSRALEEGEQRYRSVDKIYLENANSERFLLPTKKPGIAKIYARHIAEGNLPYDDKWRHINSLVEDYTKMAGFVRATRNGTFVEQAVQLVNEGLKHYNDLRMTLKGLTSHKGYNKYFESYTPVLNEETTETTNLNELFVQENLDPRIESVLPILSRLKKNIVEVAELTELSNWADGVINETLLSEEPNYDEVKSEKYEVVDKNDRRVGTWDGVQFRPYDKSKFQGRGSLDMIPLGHSVDKASGPVSDTGVGLGKLGLEEYAKPKKKDPKYPGHTTPKPKKKDPKDAMFKEGLSKQQKRVGQLGPTEKVKKNSGARGKLVGASESVDLTRLKNLSGITK